LKNITLKQALSLKCECGGNPKLGDPDELWIIYCDKCGEESIQGCRRHYATNSWWDRNKGAKNTEQANEPDSQ